MLYCIFIVLNPCSLTGVKSTVELCGVTALLGVFLGADRHQNCMHLGTLLCNNTYATILSIIYAYKSLHYTTNIIWNGLLYAFIVINSTICNLSMTSCISFMNFYFATNTLINSYFCLWWTLILADWVSSFFSHRTPIKDSLTSRGHEYCQQRTEIS